MKTRVLVLDERPTARFRWPGGGGLAVPQDDGTYLHCCLGVMACQWHGKESKEVERWCFFSEVLERCSEEWEWAAARANDGHCVYSATRAEGVAKLRKIFREEGLRRGERWVIRWIRDKGER